MNNKTRVLLIISISLILFAGIAQARQPVKYMPAFPSGADDFIMYSMTFFRSLNLTIKDLTITGVLNVNEAHFTNTTVTNVNNTGNLTVIGSIFVGPGPFNLGELPEEGSIITSGSMNLTEGDFEVSGESLFQQATFYGSVSQYGGEGNTFEYFNNSEDPIFRIDPETDVAPILAQSIQSVTHVPIYDGLYDLGHPDLRWRTLYTEIVNSTDNISTEEYFIGDGSLLTSLTHSLDDAYNDGSVINVDNTDVIWNLTVDNSIYTANDVSRIYYNLSPGIFDYAGIYVQINRLGSAGTSSGQGDSYFKIQLENATNDLEDVFSVGRTYRSAVGIPEEPHPENLALRAVSSASWFPFDDSLYDLGGIGSVCIGGGIFDVSDISDEPCCVAVGGSWSFGNCVGGADNVGCGLLSTPECQSTCEGGDAFGNCGWRNYTLRWNDLYLSGTIKGTGSGESLYMNASTGDVRFGSQSTNISGGNITTTGSIALGSASLDNLDPGDLNASGTGIFGYSVVNQLNDNEGLRIYGFDELSGNYIDIRVNQYGTAEMRGTTDFKFVAETGVVSFDPATDTWFNRYADGDVLIFKQATSGETREVKISGFRSGDELRVLEIGVGTDAPDTASFDGVSNYLFDGNLSVGEGSAQSGITMFDESGSAMCMVCWSSGECNATAGDC